MLICILKPVDKEAILSAKNKTLLVTLEEHNVQGGLGGIASEILSEESGMPRLLRLGINDIFNLAGSYDNLLGQNRLMPEQIAEDIELALS